MSSEADEVLDASGLFCPEPVMMLHNRIDQMESGEVLKVVATDPSTMRDIPKFCLFLDHELLNKQETQGRFIFYLKYTKRLPYG